MYVSSSKNLHLQLVEVIVLQENFFRQRRVPKQERLHRRSQPTLDDEAHARQVNQRLDRGMVEVARGRLSNVHREIADPLQIDGDPGCGNHKSKIDGDGLLKRQQREAALVDIGLKVVETLIVRRHPTGQRAVAGEQS